MRRICAVFFSVALLGLSGLLAWTAGPPTGPASARVEGAAPRPEVAVAVVRGKETIVDKLYKRSKFPAVEQDKNTSLEQVLAALGKTADVSFEINERAFKIEQLINVEQSAVVESAGLPGRETTLARRLKQVLARVQVPSGATFLVRRDHIEITTLNQVNAALGSDAPRQPLDDAAEIKPIEVPLVHLLVERRPLEDVLRTLADQSDSSIMLDVREGEKGKKLVSANLLNAPLDSALFLLGEMAELRLVRLDNVYYLTTPEKAQSVEAAWKLFLQRQRSPDLGGFGIPGAAGGM
jgi:hypothetical protein